jgi:hypothetical protein
MKRRFLAVGFLVFAGLACLWLASRAVTAAKPPGGPVLSPSVSVPVPVAEPVHPDLVVAQVRLVKYHQADIPSVDLTVRVKNIGNKETGPCIVALAWIWNFLDPHARQTASLLFPTLAPGATADRSATLTGIGFLPLKGMLIAAVDPARAGKPSGEVAELSGERNNVFGFTFTIPSDTPILWRNPPVPVRESPHADLVITEVATREGVGWATSASDLYYMDVTVSVKNIGTALAPPCTLALHWTTNLLDPAAFETDETQVPGLAPGVVKQSQFRLSSHYIGPPPWQAMLVLAVDPARAGKPAGEVAEYSGEFNNVFGFTFNTATSSFFNGIVWKNPAAQ